MYVLRIPNWHTIRYGGFDGQTISPPPGFGTTSVFDSHEHGGRTPDDMLGVPPPPPPQSDVEQDALLKMVASIGWDAHGKPSTDAALNADADADAHRSTYPGCTHSTE